MIRTTKVTKGTKPSHKEIYVLMEECSIEGFITYKLQKVFDRREDAEKEQKKLRVHMHKRRNSLIPCPIKGITCYDDMKVLMHEHSWNDNRWQLFFKWMNDVEEAFNREISDQFILDYLIFTHDLVGYFTKMDVEGVDSESKKFYDLGYESGYAKAVEDIKAQTKRDKKVVKTLDSLSASLESISPTPYNERDYQVNLDNYYTVVGECMEVSDLITEVDIYTNN